MCFRVIKCSGIQTLFVDLVFLLKFYGFWIILLRINFDLGSSFNLDELFKPFSYWALRKNRRENCDFESDIGCCMRVERPECILHLWYIFPFIFL